MSLYFVVLLYLSVTTRALIGELPLKFKAVSVAKMFRDLSPSVLNFYSKGGSLKLSFTLSYVLKRANDNNDFKLSRFAFEVCQKFEAVPRD